MSDTPRIVLRPFDFYVTGAGFRIEHDGAALHLTRDDAESLAFLLNANLQRPHGADDPESGESA